MTYIESLDSEAHSRYKQKLTSVGLSDCPYNLPADTWINNPTKWPEVQWPDVYSYLIDTPGVYTRESMKNYKSLDAHNFFISGWVQTVLHMVPQSGKITVFKADVKPSWRVTEEPHHSWVAVSPDGSVLTAHCDCMAGLGESCSHVGALLFKIEAAVRNGYTRLACTDIPCEWNKCFVKKVKSEPIAKINFYKEKYKQRLTQTKRGKKLAIRPTTHLKQESFLRALETLPDKPVGLSLFKETSHHFDFPDVELNTNVRRLPLPMKTLYNPANTNLTELELKQKCQEVLTLQCASKDEVTYLAESTVNQANSIIWQEQRLGRITASLAHNVLHTNFESPATSLIRSICHPQNYKYNTTAMQWGRDHEDEALEVYKESTATDHTDFIVQKCGLYICESMPYIGATPDALTSCSCCGKGVVEIKCPYKFKDDNFETILKNSDFCLNSNFELKKNTSVLFSSTTANVCFGKRLL